ncbi:MAG: hypothetical protein IPG90_12140 [Bacteroidetes bacterium]|nr:hypothetical protein [Bacteroidota bacterium]
MKKSLSLILLLSCFLMQSFVFGQPWLKQALPASKQQAHKPNFFDVQESLGLLGQSFPHLFRKKKMQKKGAISNSKDGNGL